MRTRVTAAVAVLALALGIGVNASSFISINAIVLHPLPYPKLDRIVTLWGTLPKVRTQQTPLSPGDFVNFERESHSFAALAAYRAWDANLTGDQIPERIEATRVSPNFFAVLGTGAQLGRTFANEDAAAHAREVVVSEGFWKSHLAGSRPAIGKPILLNGSSYTVIGVMPDRFDFPLGTEIWAPLELNAAEKGDREHHDLMAIGLLRPEISAGQASAELGSIASGLAKQYPLTNQDRTAIVTPLTNMADRVTNQFVFTLLGAAGFVLLLACANIGSLQLARAMNRERDIAVRAALGAGRMQIARELFAEALLISICASIIGLLLASWNQVWMRSTIPAFALRVVPGLRNMHIDATVILFTAGLSVITGVLCSLPAIAQVFRRLRGDFHQTLRSRGGAQAAVTGRNTLRTALIVFELALALVLLVGAGFMVKTFERLLYVNQGFDPKNLLTMQVALPSMEYREAARMVSFYDGVLGRFGTLRGAKAAGLLSYLGAPERLTIEGRAELQPGEPRPDVRAVSSQYLQTMRIPMIEGRFLADRDRVESPKVVVVSENVARHYFPHSSAIGHRIQLNARSGWLTIVGVSANVIEDWFQNQPAPLAYVSYAQFPSTQAMLLVRSAGDPMELARPAVRNIREVGKDVPVYDVKTMERTMYEERGGIRAAATTMITYAAIALLLAVTGIYAMISHFVGARTHDIGVRMALGASRMQVLRMTMKQSVGFIAAGLAFGIPLAALLAQAMSKALFNVVRIDAGTFALFAGVLAAAGLIASYVPSRRATKIDPMNSLRSE